MRNLKKVLAVVLTVALLAAMMTVPALAAVSYEDEALKLQTIGLFAGEPADLKLEEGVTRVQGLAFAIRAAGKEDEALAMSDADVAAELAKFTDAATVPAWAKKYTAYAIKNGITVGVGNNKLAPLANISGTSFLVFVLKSGMGYSSVTTANVIDKAIEAKVITAAQAVAFGGKAALIRDDAAAILYGAAKNGINADGKTFIQSLIDAGAVDPEDAAAAGFIEDTSTGEAEVKSVEALNLIQIKVEFSNTNFDEDEVKDESNYDFEGEVDGDDDKDVDIYKVELDGTTAILNLAEAVDNQTTGVLTLDEAITGEEVEFDDISFFDKEVPSVESVDVIGEDTVKVVFSEPIDFYPDGYVKSTSSTPIAATDLEDEFEFDLDGKTYNVDEILPTSNDKEVNVVVYGTFKEGTLSVDIGNGLEDYAGFNVVADTFEVDVVKDDEPPVVTGFKDADRDEVTLIFDNSVRLTSDADEEDFYHTNDNNTVDSLSDVEIDDEEVTLNFSEDNELPEGTAYVYIKSGAIEDLWGNENDSIKVKVEVNVDETAPTVTDLDFDGGNLKITFSEKLDEDSANDEDNYTLYNTSDDEEVDVRKAVVNPNPNSDDEAIVTITPKDAFEEGDVYEITVKDVEDTAGNKIDEYSEEIEYSDDSAPDLHGVYLDTDATSHKYILYVEFNEELTLDGSYAADDLSKYELYHNGTRVTNLGDAEDDFDNTSVDLKMIDNNKTVKITIKSTDFTVAVGDKLEIGRLADLDGNYTAFRQDPTIEDLDDEHVNIDTVKATAKDTLEVKFTGNLDSVEAADFFIARDVLDEGDAAATLEIDNIDIVDADEIDIILDEDLPADVGGYKLFVITTQADIETENAFGAKLEAGDNKTITDKIAPAVAELDNVNTDKTYDYNVAHPNYGTEDDVQSVYATETTTGSVITIVFDEAIDASLVQTRNFEVNDGDNEVTDVQLVNAYTLQITVDGQVYQGDDIDVAVIADAAGNRTVDLSLSIEYATE